MSQQPIRILRVVTQMNRAGIESRLMELYREVDRSVVQFDFYTLRETPGQFDEEILSLGGKIYYNPPLSVSRFYDIPKRFETFFRAHPEYQIVHAHMNQWCGLILKGAKAAGVPVRIAQAHTSLNKLSLQCMVKNILKQPVNRYATDRIAVSDYAGKWLYGKKKVKQGEVLFWKNGIETERYVFSEEIRAMTRKELGLADEFTLMHVGNLRPEKNHEFLFRVFAEVLKEKPNSRLVLVGKDMSDGRLLQLAEEMQIAAKTMFLGSRKDVAQLLQAGDVFVFPSFYEGFPTAVLEAQATGLPCVISDTITREIAVTPLVEFRSIQTKPSEWARCVLAKEDTNRINVSDMIVRAGHSLSDSVERVQKFYLSKMEEISRGE